MPENEEQRPEVPVQTEGEEPATASDEGTADAEGDDALAETEDGEDEDE